MFSRYRIREHIGNEMKYRKNLHGDMLYHLFVANYWILSVAAHFYETVLVVSLFSLVSV